MITGDWNKLQQLADNSVCGDCDGHLTVAWDDKQSVHFLNCGKCGATKSIKKVLSPTQAYKQGEALPPAVENNVKKGLERRSSQIVGGSGRDYFPGIPKTDLGSGEALTPQVLQRLTEYARSYGLDPWRSHVCLMYGKPYITLDGYMYHASHQQQPFSLNSRPLTDEERKQYQIKEGDHAWRAEITFVDTGAYLMGQGIVTQDEINEPSKKNPEKLAAPVVAKHPWQLAQKRAEWQALRRAFPIGESGEET